MLKVRNLLFVLVALVAAPIAASASVVVDGFWDGQNADGYTLSKESYIDLGCASMNCPDQGVLGVTQDANNIYIMFAQQTSVSDNSFGTNAVDWSMGHTLDDLLGSDKAEFILTNSTGTVVFDQYIDYASDITAGNAGMSGASTDTYQSAGLGGDGGGAGTVNSPGTGVGASAFVTAKTSLGYDLNSAVSSCATAVKTSLNSPDIDGVSGNTNTANSTYLADNTNPSCNLTLPAGYTTTQGWLFSTVYEVEISKAALNLPGGTFNVDVYAQHNSPSKGTDTDDCDAATGNILAPSLCNQGQGGSPTPEPSSLLLLGSGVLGLRTALLRRKKR